MGPAHSKKGCSGCKSKAFPWREGGIESTRLILTQKSVNHYLTLLSSPISSFSEHLPDLGGQEECPTAFVISSKRDHGRTHSFGHTWQWMVTVLCFPCPLEVLTLEVRPVTRSTGRLELKRTQRWCWEYDFDGFWSDPCLTKWVFPAREAVCPFKDIWVHVLCSAGFIVFISWCWDLAAVYERECTGYAIRLLENTFVEQEIFFFFQDFILWHFAWSTFLPTSLMCISFQGY